MTTFLTNKIQSLTSIVVVVIVCCKSIPVRSRHCASFVPSRADRDHVPSDNFLISHIPRTLTHLQAGRERRLSSADNNKPLSSEQKLISAKESARLKRVGQMKHRLQKSIGREDRISILELKRKDSASMSVSESADYMTKAEQAELQGLLKVRDTFEEQYNPLIFTKEHLEFKDMHNDAFIQLSRYCERERNRLHRRSIENKNEKNVSGNEMYAEESANVFFLDGPDGGTASALINQGGFEASQCYVANRHESSCKALRISGGGLLPEENVVYATASEGLTIAQPLSLAGVEGTTGGENDSDIALYSGEDGALAHVDFSAYYFDGCGGFVPHIVGMLSAALLRQSCDASRPVAVGYSLLGGNKNVVGKELAVSQALTIIARRRGMRMEHVLDDPLQYGISTDIQKIGGSGGGGTFTTWLLLRPA